MRRLAIVAGTLTILVGLVHAVVGVREYAWPSFDALWFHGSGIALVLIGAITTLAASPRAWRTLVVVAVAANVLGVLLAIAFGALSHWRAPQGPILIALFTVSALGCLIAHKHS